MRAPWRAACGVPALALAAVLAAWACAAAGGPQRKEAGGSMDEWRALREKMVATQIETEGIRDAAVLAAMREVPRHRFVPQEMIPHAYEDRPLPIGEGQTISQPYIVALMSELARVTPGERVLEVGTGSGYQAAVLARMGASVHTIEILPGLAASARRVLEDLGVEGLSFRVGDGYGGWPEAAPFDAIVVTAAPDHVPQPLIDQLAEGGRLVIPVGDASQKLVVLTRTAGGIERQEVAPVRFVPMTGEAGRP